MTIARWKIFLPATLLLGVALWTGMDMVSRMEESLLWGYRPLALLGAGYLSLTMFLLIRTKKAAAQWRPYVTMTVVGLMMGLSFPDLPFLPLLFLAWVVFYDQLQRHQTERMGYQWRLWLHAIMVWNIISTYWISNTALAAGVVAIIANALLMTLPVWVYQVGRRRLPARFHFFLFAASWLTFEYIHFRWEAHWPWLTLGHYFMDMPWLIQWYSYTGVLGGSLWILMIMGGCYSVWRAPNRRRRWLQLTALLVVPIVLSYIIGSQVLQTDGGVNVVVVQPNQEPHYEKGRRAAPFDMRWMLSIADSLVDETTDVIVTPETSFDVRLNRWHTDRSIHELEDYMKGHDQLEVLMGMGSSRVLLPGDEHDAYTRTHVTSRGDTIYWENHNAALRYRDKEDYDIYYKSKLVPGAEFFPFKGWMFFIKPLVDKLGGSASGLRMQDHRVAYDLLGGSAVAPIICYESVFGEYVSGYVHAGADWMAVVTNDGWWDRTAGHKQHLGLSVIRAIEQRRWIARAANTGISCFIDPYGRVHQATSYGQTGAIKRRIQRISTRTVYNRLGDVIGRLAMFCLLLCLGLYLLRAS